MHTPYRSKFTAASHDFLQQQDSLVVLLVNFIYLQVMPHKYLSMEALENCWNMHFCQHLLPF